MNIEELIKLLDSKIQKVPFPENEVLIRKDVILAVIAQLKQDQEKKHEQDLLRILNEWLKRIEKNKVVSESTEDWLKNYNSRAMVLDMAIKGGGLWRQSGECPETYERYRKIMGSI